LLGSCRIESNETSTSRRRRWRQLLASRRGSPQATAMSSLHKLALLCWRLTRVALFNSRGLRPILGTALAASENHLTRATDPTRLPGVSLEKLLASAGQGLNLELFFCPEASFAINLLEALALASLVRLAGAKRAFEFGTYRGVSSSQIALNLI